MTSLLAEEHGGKAWCAASMPIKRACSWNPERLSDFQFGQSRKPRKRDLGGYERLHVQARMMARYGVVRRGRWRELRGWCRGEFIFCRWSRATISAHVHARTFPDSASPCGDSE